jgi:hypothetical protein
VRHVHGGNCLGSDLSAASYIHFDFHKECSKMRWDRISLLINDIKDDVERHGYLFRGACLCVSMRLIARLSLSVSVSLSLSLCLSLSLSVSLSLSLSVSLSLCLSLCLSLSTSPSLRLPRGMGSFFAKVNDEVIKQQYGECSDRSTGHG